MRSEPRRAVPRPPTPFWIRLWHAAHALLFLLLAVTGWHLYLGSVELWGYARSVRLHEAAGMVAAVLTAAHVVGLLVSGAWRDYLPPRRGLARAVARELARSTLGIWRDDTSVPGERRLNPVQQLLYAPLLLLVLPGIALTGLVLLAAQIAPKASLGSWPDAILAAAHAALALAASLFLLLHLYMATLVGGEAMRRRPRLRRPAAALLLVLASSEVFAAEGEVGRRQPPLPCLGCHSGTPSSRRIVVDPRAGTRKDVTVELARMKEGVHAALACPACHSRGFERFPHRPAAERRLPACRDCHPRQEPAAAAAADARYDFAQIESEHRSTAHAPVFRKERGQRDCEACHHPHTLRPSAALATPSRLRAEHDAPCVRCHESGAAGPLTKPLRPELVAAHDRIPAADRHLASVRCIDCHASRGRSVAHDLLDGRAASGCVDCHRPHSALLAGLWRFAPEAPASRSGFTHATLLDAHRVMAVTRLEALDRLALGGLAALACALAAHAGMRVLARLRRSVHR